MFDTSLKTRVVRHSLRSATRPGPAGPGGVAHGVVEAMMGGQLRGRVELQEDGVSKGVE